ncbi:hypothetical protein SEA_BOLT007_63 [Arthrobacter phage Bolt007]|uniref:Uncharacterized protein n=1 Tax=Arthrobacter phage Bolt007 TaxID=3017297 RepID=A0AA49I8F2_9CAUD|nr:hypothetical protein SEA_BOLT007_63 [Arthrobacter phage Bolt007]
MTDCHNCEEPIVSLTPIGWVHRDGYSTRCEVEGPFRGLVATPPK